MSDILKACFPALHKALQWHKCHLFQKAFSDHPVENRLPFTLLSPILMPALFSYQQACQNLKYCILFILKFVFICYLPLYQAENLS